MNDSIYNVKCPHCGKPFSIESALEKELSGKLREKIETEVRKIAEEEMQAKSKLFKKDLEEKSRILKEVQERESELLSKQTELLDKVENAGIDFQRRLIEEREKIKEQAEKMANSRAEVLYLEKEQNLRLEKEEMETALTRRVSEETERIRGQEQMKQAELQKKLDDQIKLANEMKRKYEQGSMQTQGEVQEVELEKLLKASFPDDNIIEVAKGQKGADCIQIIRNDLGRDCGKIIYESKRTKAWSNDWIAKLKTNMRMEVCDLALIVTETLPKEIKRFGQLDGIWVCTFKDVHALAFLMRESLIRINGAIVAQENKGEKTLMLYNYLTGNEFRQSVEAIVEAFSQMHTDLEDEKKRSLKQWAQREKQILKVMENTVSMYGSVRGIAGGAVKAIKELEMGEENLLTSPLIQ